MVLWQVKDSANGTYRTLKSPSSYDISWEDLDNGSYRSINTGNLNRTIVSKAWSKMSFKYKYLTQNEIKTILPILNRYPIYVRIKSPIFGGDYVEMEMYCSNKSSSMLETGDYTLSFNLIQSKKVSGQ